MAGFENASIWKSTLAKQLGPDVFENERETFRVNYENFRENASLLAGEIARDLPDYTVHDITHLDALWEMASIICGPKYELNPAEAFVLGGAFLIHDLGMGLAAYPDGIDELKGTIIWNDTKAFLYKQEPEISSEKLDKEVTEVVLRSLHAKHAEKLALISWGLDEKYYLISNPELREAYGAIIGLIAHSHWWSSDELLEKLPNQLGAFGAMPNHWVIDPIKLACLMRAADAAHIDSRRAPSFLKEFRKPSEYATQHWLFQQKLYQPRLESERLIYTSKASFTLEESKSWWLCFEALQVIDSELRSVDSLLGDTGKVRFAAKGVAAISNLKMLAKLIGTQDWYPIDTSIHVGNVAKLVANLGGEQLYGKNNLVPLRELIQNSCDAVRARRMLEDEDSEWGLVSVSTGTDKIGNYIEVEDNGVGMSTAVLSGPFLDFGTSFWGTTMMHREFPGLESQGFSSTGKYGVGFFSTFMWGERVSVTTRRFEEGRDATKVLVFENGLTGRPLLRKAEKSEFIKDGGTRIRVYISDYEVYRSIFKTSRNDELDFDQVIEDLCPSVDVSIKSIDFNSDKKATIIKANDWKTLESTQFIKRVLGHRQFKMLNDECLNSLIELSQNVRDITVDGEVIGRGFLSNTSNGYSQSSQSIVGTVTVGGFRTSGLPGIVGLFVGATNRASRDICEPLVTLPKTKEWVENQEALIAELTDKSNHLYLASRVRTLGGFPKYLDVAICREGEINIDRFVELIRSLEGEIFIVFTASVSNLENKYNGKMLLNDNVFATDVGALCALEFTAYRHHSDWPREDFQWFHGGTLEGVLIEAFADTLNVSLEQVKTISDFSGDEVEYQRSIGTINGVDIKADVDVIRSS